MITIGSRFVLLKNSLVREDQAGQKTAEEEGGDGYSVQANSKISSSSSVVQPSGGLMSPYFIYNASWNDGDPPHILILDLLVLYLLHCTRVQVIHIQKSCFEKNIS